MSSVARKWEYPVSFGVAETSRLLCRSSPNCVSSDEVGLIHGVEPFRLSMPVAYAWPVVIEVVSELPNALIVEVGEDYVRAECSIPVFGFVDDLELHLRQTDRLVAVRSASRIGEFDLFVNRWRVRRLRSALRRRGVVR